MTAANDLAVRQVLEAAGVEFIDENGSGQVFAFVNGHTENQRNKGTTELGPHRVPVFATTRP